MKVSQALLRAAAKLKAAHVPDGMRDARKILKHMAGTNIHDNDVNLSDLQLSEFESKIEQRSRFRPVAQIIGEREFWCRSFIVNSDVLDPRPETELLLEIATMGNPRSRILDLGTGSGVLAISLLKHWLNATALAADISTKALEVARRNAVRHGVENRLEVIESNWLNNVEGKFDLIVCNPPYIAEDEMAGLAPDVRLWEPRLALTPGADGTAVYRLISSQLVQFLLPGASAVFEVGTGQADNVASMLQSTGLGTVAIHHDLAGHQRAVSLNLAT